MPISVAAIGYNSLIVHDYDWPLNVTGYNRAGRMAKDLHTATAALAYVLYCWFTTKQTLYPRFAHNLLSRLQVRLNDVMVNNCPCFLTECITNQTHSILVIPVDGSNQPYMIPLVLQGVTSSFVPTCKLSVTESYYDKMMLVQHLLLMSKIKRMTCQTMMSPLLCSKKMD